MQSKRFHELVKFSLGWMQSNSACTDCHGIDEVHKYIVKAGSICNEHMSINQWKTCPQTTSLTKVPSRRFVVAGQKYKLMAAVSDVVSSAGRGYQYKSILSVSGKWLHCTDLSVSTENWPHGSMSMFYHLNLLYQLRKYSWPWYEICSTCKVSCICEAIYSAYKVYKNGIDNCKLFQRWQRKF